MNFTQDFSYGPDTLINLVKSYDYTPKDLTWIGDVGFFSINDEKFRATITPASLDDEITYSYF